MVGPGGSRSPETCEPRDVRIPNQRRPELLPKVGSLESVTPPDSEPHPRPLAAARGHRAPDRDAAREIARESHVRALGTELYGLAERTDTRDPGRSHFLPLAALTAGWLTRVFSDHTRTAYKADITRFYRWCAERTINPATTTTAEYERYARWLSEADPDQRGPAAGRSRYGTATRGRYLAAVAAFYVYAKDELGHNPTVQTPRSATGDGTRHRILTPDEQDALWHAVTHWPARKPGDYLDGLTMTAAVALGLDQAWRPGQLYAARVGHLTTTDDHQCAIITAIRGQTRYTDVLTARARHAVSDLLINGRGFTSNVWRAADSGPAYAPLLTATHNRPMGRGWFSYTLEEAAITAGIDPGRKHEADRITPHVLRRTAVLPTPDTEPPETEEP